MPQQQESITFFLTSSVVNKINIVYRNLRFNFLLGGADHKLKTDILYIYVPKKWCGEQYFINKIKMQTNKHLASLTTC